MCFFDCRKFTNLIIISYNCTNLLYTLNLVLQIFICKKFYINRWTSIKRIRVSIEFGLRVVFNLISNVSHCFGSSVNNLWRFYLYKRCRRFSKFCLCSVCSGLLNEYFTLYEQIGFPSYSLNKLNLSVR